MAETARLPNAAAMTATQQQILTQPAQSSVEAEVPTLTLRLQPRASVTWDQDVVDNEGLGKKSSKKCCIFHKKRDFGESSSDESDSDMSDSEREKKWKGKQVLHP